MLISVRSLRQTLPLSLLSALLFPVFLSGCSHSHTNTPEETRAIEAMKKAEATQTRQQLEMIPAPAKAQYMAVKSLNLWQNPYITVQGSMLTLHVMLADANTSQMGKGGLLRPLGARRRNLNIRVGELSAALNAIPQNCWPYGRVVALEEAHEAPKRDEPEIRRNMETVVKTLNNLGIVPYDWSDSGKS